MKKLIRNALIILLLGFFILGNPSELRFLNEVKEDFGEIHHGVSLSTDQLKVIGTSSYQSYFLLSFYQFTFGTIQVKYVGLGFMTFYVGSTNSHQFEDKTDTTYHDTTTSPRI